MKDPYQDFPNLKSLTIPERTQMFRETILFLLTSGKEDLISIEKVENDFRQIEVYEAIEGMKLAIIDFKKLQP